MTLYKEANLLDIVNLIDGVIGTKDPQLLLHPIKDQSLPELEAEGLHHLDQVFWLDLADHLHSSLYLRIFPYSQTPVRR